MLRSIAYVPCSMTGAPVDGGGMQFLRSLVFPGGFMPHGYCCLWGLTGPHVASDSLIALSDISSPVTLTYVAQLNQVLGCQAASCVPEKRS